jgi:hypothetical protein
MSSAIGLAIITLIGLWLAGGVVMRLGGVLVAMAGVIGLAIGAGASGGLRYLVRDADLACGSGPLCDAPRSPKSRLLQRLTAVDRLHGTSRSDILKEVGGKQHLLLWAEFVEADELTSTVLSPAGTDDRPCRSVVLEGRIVNGELLAGRDISSGNQEKTSATALTQKTRRVARMVDVSRICCGFKVMIVTDLEARCRSHLRRCPGNFQN